MSLLWMDGFDTQTQILVGTGGLYETLLSQFNQSITTAGVRTGTRGLLCGALSGGVGGVRKNLTANYQTTYVGAAISLQAANFQAGTLFGWVDANGIQCSLNVDFLGRVQFFRGGTAITSVSTTQIPFNQFHYVEGMATIGSGSGTVQAKIDGALVLSASGVNNMSTSNAFVNQINFGAIGSAYYDDVYILDSSGPAPFNGFLGDIAVVEFVPSGVGSFAQFTQGGATHANNYQQVNEIGPDGDTTYVATATIGNRDSYVFPSYPPAALINPGVPAAIMTLVYGEADATGSRVLQLTARESGTDAFSPNIIQGLGYAYQYWLTVTDVNGNAWSAGHLNATEFGFELIA